MTLLLIILTVAAAILTGLVMWAQVRGGVR